MASKAAALAVLLLLVALCVAEELVLRDKDRLGVEGPCSRQFKTAEFEDILMREDACTAVVVGATWDGHYKGYRNLMNWVNLTNELCGMGVDFGYYYFSGSATENALPPVCEDWEPGTRGSYEMRVFGWGKHLGLLRSARARAPVEEVAEELFALCGLPNPYSPPSAQRKDEL
mmetsp:Transcript_9813/g.39829  ORF Transcript_9813/g.39829 Transcript_9813/m.39829 type:complete len:173 (+) Transcript_9813:31-549(+)|eukprot:CAMPEP_0114631612 /NCGR_PEP_ID=MMETSP0168-20121206/14506_1 /TAXON_ID=95228 ORGANISM="Vannella sp., Strain DIVA3 517/6/12" /NCGR_SAMPLE_ID=MMETSP0168 /ASSEMBLY_ACC=CAM_ASM_000044 /LENGTH=172 /DNA_ID=CAMNT_0001843191 /DNA_START=22 /DNA_END=540 /DNA_ORIENTATION=+